MKRWQGMILHYHTYKPSHFNTLKGVCQSNVYFLQVQGLEGLSDQIIVASVDDTLTFGDSSALEGLGETDSQVGGHLTHISEILSTNQNQPVVRFLLFYY